MEDARSELIKKEVRSVLITYPKGVLLQDFIKQFRLLLGKRLPTREFGFYTDLDFLESMPEVVRIRKNNYGDYHLSCIADETTAHIKELVVKQRTVKSNLRTKTINMKNQAFKTEPFQLNQQKQPHVNKSDHGDSLNSKAILSSEQNKVMKDSSYAEVKSKDSENSLDKQKIKVVDSTKRLLCNPVSQKKDNTEVNKSEQVDDLNSKAILGSKQKNFMKDSSKAQVNNRYLVHSLDKFVESSTRLQKKDNTETHKSEQIDDLNSTAILTNEQKSNTSDNILTEANSKESKISQLKGFMAANSSNKEYCNFETNTDSDSSEKRQIIFKNCKEIMRVFADGILAKHFPFWFEKICGKEFLISDLGYNNYVELAEALPDTFVCIKLYEGANDYMLYHPSFYKNVNKPKESKELKLGEDQQKSPISPVSVIAFPPISYLDPQLPSDIDLTIFIPVLITAVRNPSCFWLQIQLDSFVQRRKKLEEEIQHYYYSSYAETLKMCHLDIKMGWPCVTLYENYWYRATITSSPTDEFVKVYLVDLGMYHRVHCSSLRYLKYSFVTLPAQAFKAELALVKPSRNAVSWSRRAEARFIEILMKFNFKAKIVTKFRDFLSVLLCDTSREDAVYVNNTLVNEGLAAGCPAKTSSNDVSDSFEKGVTVNADQSSISNCEYDSKNLSPQRISLGEGYYIYLIFLSNHAYVSAADMVSLFWSDKSAEDLIQKLRFRNCDAPVKIVSKDEYHDLFEKCENLSIKGFHKERHQQYSVSLFSSNHIMKIINCIGHASIIVRETIKKVIEALASEFNEQTVIDLCKSLESHEENPEDRRDVFERYSLYDLQALSKFIEGKRIILKEDSSEEDCDKNAKDKEMRRLENMLCKIEERKKYIKSIICKYS